MIEMFRIYSKGFLENVTIEALPPGLSFTLNSIGCRNEFGMTV
jgi:hypothetical protein